jgi:Sucrase/ferredoxin-like
VTSAGPAPGVRCALAAQARGDEMAATAPPARQFLLVEVPGPWVPDAWAAAGLSLDLTGQLQEQTARTAARLMLIRRPGRHPAEAGEPRRWAVVARGAGARWGTWSAERDLKHLDVAAELSQVNTRQGRPLALVCTHGRHDVCCALEGRPVADALASDPRLDVWECSHLGGDRFAANVLWLPSGLLFGGLTAATASMVAEAVLSDRVVLDHFRGRFGDATLAQAAQRQVMRARGEDRPAAVEVLGVLGVLPDETDGTGLLRRPLLRADQVALRDGQVLSVVARHGGTSYRVDLVPAWTPPHHLTCRAVANSRMRIFVPVGEPIELLP